jgi:hypothetical protein
MPDEVIFEIFRNLPSKDKRQASQVCQRWYRLSKEPVLWVGNMKVIEEEIAKRALSLEHAKTIRKRLEETHMQDIEVQNAMIQAIVWDRVEIGVALGKGKYPPA